MPSLTDSPIYELAHLHRDGAMHDFYNRFMALSCREPALTEPLHVQLFVAGLGPPLRTDVALLQPQTLDEAIKLARAYEQRLASPPPTPTWTASHSFTKLATSTPVTPQQSTSSVSSVGNKTSCCHKNQCFHYNDQYVHGHKEQCKQLFTIEVIADKPPKQPSIVDLTISLHSLTKIQSCSRRTMQVSMIINGCSLAALLDSSSTHNFVDSTTAERVGLRLQYHSSFRMAMANGDRIDSPGCC
jgi:hypothetical protein